LRHISIDNNELDILVPRCARALVASSDLSFIFHGNIFSMSELLKELQENMRLRLGIWGVSAILLSYPLLLLRDYEHSLALAHGSALEQLHRLRDISAQDAWAEQAERARALRVQAEDKLWRADSRGLAQATLQSWLQAQLKIAGIEKPRVTVESTIDAGPGLWKVSAKCDAPFEAAKLELLLKILATHPQWLVVERLETRMSHSPQFSLLLSAYFHALSEGDTP
jgi:hypothetical protein